MKRPDSDETAQLTAANRQLATLVEMIKIFNSSLELNVVIDRFLECATKAMEAEAASLLVLDKETGDLLWYAATGDVGSRVLDTVRLPKGRGIAGWAAEHGTSVLVEDAYEDPRFDPEVDSKTGFRTRSVICAPLLVRGTLVGVAEAINRKSRSGRSFTPEQLQFFRRLCDNGAVAVQNALLHEELILQERQRRDFELAQRIQQSFLPDPPEGLKGYRVTMRNESALQVGGDLYEFFRIEPGVHFFCIGDVCGKGVPAALYMARLMSQLRYVAPNLKQPATIFTELNKVTFKQVMRGLGMNVFVTSIAGRLEEEGEVLTLAGAGHPRPILLRRDREPVEVELPNQPPLGLVQDLVYEQVPIRLGPGERLLLYTDGFIEAPSPDRDIVGLAGLMEWLADWKDDPADLIDFLIERVRRHSGGNSAADDLTAMVIERTGTA